MELTLMSKGSGCGSVGRAVASNARGLRFESSIEKAKIKTKGDGKGPLETLISKVKRIFSFLLARCLYLQGMCLK